MLPDHEIARLIEHKIIGLTPYSAARLNPASVDLTLCPMLRRPHVEAQIDMAEVQPEHTKPVKIHSEDGYVIYPEFLLAATEEILTLPDDIVARVEGKSSIGRVGLAVHITAGFIDPGFEGQVTLEVANLSPWPIRLRAGMRIAQVAFSVLDSPSHAPYGSAGVGHYQGQRGPVESRFKIK